MDGFLVHLQNEQKEAVIKEEPHLHIYSSNDVDMWVPYKFLTSPLFIFLSFIFLFIYYSMWLYIWP